MLDRDHKLKTQRFFKNVIKNFDSSGKGNLSVEEVGKALKAIGRPLDDHSLDNLVNKHSEAKDGNSGPRLDCDNTDFLAAVAALPVTSTNPLEEAVLKIAFSTFDQDIDGFLQPSEMQAAMKLLLPPKSATGDLDQLMYNYDTNFDGQICYEEFVQCLKDSVGPDFLKYCDPFISIITTFLGFIVYLVSLYVGLSVAWNWSYEE